MLFQPDDNTSIFLNKQFTLTERKCGAVDVSMDFRVRDTWALTFTSFRAKSFVETITAPGSYMQRVDSLTLFLK